MLGKTYDLEEMMMATSVLGSILIGSTDPERRPGGLFATLVDPDGSYVQIIEFNRDKDRDQEH